MFTISLRTYRVLHAICFCYAFAASAYIIRNITPVDTAPVLFMLAAMIANICIYGVYLLRLLTKKVEDKTNG